MHTADGSVRHIFKGTPFEAEAQAYRRRLNYEPFIRDMEMEPGLTLLLERLKPHVGLAVATNRSDTIEKVLQWSGLHTYFDLVVSSLDVTHPKPHPESLVKITHFFKIPPQDALYVGDSSVDAETAEAAGVPFVAYKNRSLRADFYVSRLVDITGLVLNDQDTKNPILP
jgi:HAD superfamily hydrolase (TIGR01509 family)